MGFFQGSDMSYISVHGENDCTFMCQMAVSKFEQYVSQAQSHTQVMGDFPTIKCLCLPDTS